MVAGLEIPTGGSIIFEGQDITKLKGGELRKVRRRIQMVFQDSTSSLNPRRRIRDIMLDPLQTSDLWNTRKRLEMVYEMLENVGLSVDFAYKYPYSLSGGQRQRVAIARALILNPQLVILDEPTSSLDVSVQANIISLLRKLQKELDVAYIFISHNLSLVRAIAHDVVVMYLGRTIETTGAEELYSNPLHPYTTALLSMIPTMGEEEDELLPRKVKLVGEIPSSSTIPQGCRFVTRCPFAMPLCSRIEPIPIRVGGHELRCHLYQSMKVAS